MEKRIIYLSFLVLVSLFTSCIVQAPRYAGVEQVNELKTGMSVAEVDKTLGITPYYTKVASDTVTVLLYKFRPIDRKTLSFFMRKTNGKLVYGKYMDLHITFKGGTARSFEVFPEATPSEQRSNINLAALYTVITVVVPSILVYLGIHYK